MYQFEQPEWLWALAGLPMLWLVMLWYRAWQGKARRRLADEGLLDRLLPTTSKGLSGWRNLLFSLAYAFLVLAMANPQVGSRMETVKRQGADLVIAVDVSNSMMAEDLPAGRLEQARQVVSKLLDELVADRVGMVVYAGRAYVQLPLTTDYGAARMFLRSLSPGMVSAQGTALASAMEESMTLFDPSEARSRVVFLITDGEDHEAGLDQVLNQAKELGIIFVPIGVGTEEGAPIPEKQNGKILDYKRDESGAVVVSKRNSTVLKELADKSGGVYISGNRSKEAIDEVMDLLENLERTESESRVFSAYESHYDWMLIPALILLMLEGLIPLARKKAKEA